MDYIGHGLRPTLEVGLELPLASDLQKAPPKKAPLLASASILLGFQPPLIRNMYSIDSNGMFPSKHCFTKKSRVQNQVTPSVHCF